MRDAGLLLFSFQLLKVCGIGYFREAFLDSVYLCSVMLVIYSDVSIIGNSISIIEIESKVTAIRFDFDFQNFVPHQFFHTLVV
jgi:hypothetical protein